MAPVGPPAAWMPVRRCSVPRWLWWWVRAASEASTTTCRAWSLNFSNTVDHSLGESPGRGLRAVALPVSVRGRRACNDESPRGGWFGARLRPRVISVRMQARGRDAGYVE